MTEKTELRSILATDCGSTTTKAILIQKKGDEYRLVVRGEAPAVSLEPRDVLHVFSRWDVQDREQVHIAGEVRQQNNDLSNRGVRFVTAVPTLEIL